MREIKFRCFVSSAKLMVDWEEMKKHGDFYRLLGMQDQYPIMQFTGLNDKNGVEIYEGDIIKWGHIEGYNERITRCATVEFSPELVFKTFNLGNNNKMFGFSNFMYKCTDKALEVIGNIHENPELLKGAAK